METMMPLEYQRRMDKIIAKGGAVNETLIALLDEAKRFTIASDVTKKVTKNRTKRKKPKGYKISKYHLK
jgi:hypothetical protein